MKLLMRNIEETLGLNKNEVVKMPSTIFFNEGWMLRIFLNWYSKNYMKISIEGLPKSNNWFSEASLRTIFSGKRDSIGREGSTSADGVIGSFSMRDNKVSGITISNDEKVEFAIIEAKIGSPLSKGVTYAKYFDQAARNVGCLITESFLANVKVDLIEQLTLIVLTSKNNVNYKEIKTLATKKNVITKLNKRYDEFIFANPNKIGVLKKWNVYKEKLFKLKKININVYTWEYILDLIKDIDHKFYEEYKHFYVQTLKHNKVGHQET